MTTAELSRTIPLERVAAQAKEIDPVRMPPHDRVAERALLGGMLRNSRLIAEVVSMIRDDDFYVLAHGLIFKAMASLADKGREVDLVTIVDVLTHAGKIDDAGGHGYVAGLWDDSPSTGAWKRYAEIIRDYADRRNLANACAELQHATFDLGTPAQEIIARAEQRIMDISSFGVVGESVELQTALMETYHRLDARKGKGDELHGVPTGFRELDELLCGFQDSELIIVGARPSCGKTAFGLAIARYAAVDCELPVFFVSLEQARVELAERLLCTQGQVDSHKLRRGHLSAQDQNDLMEAGAILGRSKMHINDSPGQTMLQISASARRLKQRHGIRLIVLDYLQLVVSDNHRANRQEQVADTSRRLKNLARELKVPVIALCQVNRGPEDRTDKKPRLSDLRESGAIEQDADTVIMLHRPQAEMSLPQCTIEVHVAKQRNGPIGEVELMYVKRFMRFENKAHGEYP